jgi:formylglycine-generating enzyme required for sulfatase activity
MTSVLGAFVLLVGCTVDYTDKSSFPCARDGTCPDKFYASAGGAECTCEKLPANGAELAPAPSSCPAGTRGIPGGVYKMARRGGAVSVSAYCLDETELTTGVYEASCAACGGTQTGEPWCNAGAAKAGHPINCLAWNQADCCCTKLGKRLPTEEEWEWAARHGADAWLYAWGDTAPTAQDACWNGLQGTCAVGQFPAYGFGLRDVAGNVWEWTATPLDAETMVLRGGAWKNNVPDYLSIGYRAAEDPSRQSATTGVRCALTP